MDRPNKPRLIAVDDERECAALVAETATAIGFEVDIATNINEFLHTWQGTQYDVIVIDMVMPDTDGIELIGILADQRCTSAIIMVSGYDEDLLNIAGKLAEGKGLNLHGTLTKPIDPHKMEALLQSAIGNYPAKERERN